MQSVKRRPAIDCDYGILVVKFRLKLKKVGKTARPFRYDLKVKVTSRFKGSVLADRVPEELWTEVCNTVQEVISKAISNKKKCKKVKWLSEEVLHIAEERREAKSKGERERNNQLNAEF